MEQMPKEEKEALKPCHKCGRTVKIRQEWHFNKTRLAIHCKCGNHLSTDWVNRGEPLPLSREDFAFLWNTMEYLAKEAKEREVSDGQDI